MGRDQQLAKIINSGAPNATDQLVEGAWALVKDYPKRPNGYDYMMAAIEDYEYDGKTPRRGRWRKNWLPVPRPPKRLMAP